MTNPLELTQLAPKPEPEVEDRQRFPKPGSIVWLERYGTVIKALDMMIDANPSTDEAVQLALVELSAAIHEDMHRVRND